MSLAVCWHEGIHGVYSEEGAHGRSRYACAGLLNDAFDSYGTFEHYSGFESLPRNTDGCIMIIHGGHERHDADKINEDASKLQWVLFIIIGDEEADFKEQKLWHRNFIVWRQSPIPGISQSSRYPIVGYPVDCCELLVHGQERIYDWSFAGQVTHARRHECVEAASKLPNGYLVGTQQFYSGLPHDEYFKILGQSKIVLCPSGPVNSDTFRLAEALEAGAIPICDEHPGWRDQPTTGIFDMLFPDGVFFPVVKSWSQLPRTIEFLLANYGLVRDQVNQGWKDYKRNYFSWLGTDLKSLGVSL
jgi:hypothetical protein